MPYAAKRPCPICGKATSGTCCIDPARKERNRLYDRQWRKARLQYLASNPLCEDCTEAGKTTLAEHVHHKIKHEGDVSVFWNIENWQGLCEKCHNKRTAKGE